MLVLYMLAPLCLYVVYSDLLRGLELKKDDLPSQMDQTKWVSNSVEWQVCTGLETGYNLRPNHSGDCSWALCASDVIVHRSCCHGNRCLFDDSGSYRHSSCMCSGGVYHKPVVYCIYMVFAPVATSQKLQLHKCMWMLQRRTAELIHNQISGIYSS